MPTFFNRATLRYGGSEIDSNTVRGELSAALAIDKTAVNAVYRPGDAVAFAITLTNSGANEAAELQLRDDLGAYAFGTERRVPLEYVQGSARYFVNGELQPAPEAEIGDGLVFRGVRVPANGSAALLYAARVNDFAPLGEGASITNTVRLDDEVSAGSVLPANPNAAGGASAANSAMPVRAYAQPQEVGAPALPLFASAVILPESAAQLSIRKALSPESISPGEEITYTLTIENAGASAVSAGEGAAVTDVFNPRMNISSVRFNGELWTSPANYGYDPGTGAFVSAPGQLTVPAASFSQDASTGRWRIQPGASVLEITGTLR